MAFMLIKEEATMFTSIQELLEEMHHTNGIQSIAHFDTPKPSINYDILNESERQILELLKE